MSRDDANTADGHSLQVLPEKGDPDRSFEQARLYGPIAFCNAGCDRHARLEMQSRRSSEAASKVHAGRTPAGAILLRYPATDADGNYCPVLPPGLQEVVRGQAVRPHAGGKLRLWTLNTV